jgi:aryl-alcohol dehydrogenase-like predicted oxidoreductase
MEHRALGSLSVSVVGIGCNNFGARLDEAGTADVVHAALDAGINFFDTADIYGGTQSEVLLGRALRQRRHEAIIATKFGMPIDDTRFGAKPAYIRQALEDSLSRLNVDHVDLYQLHYPDQDTPLEDTLATLSDLVDEGKVREIGCSNFNGPALLDAAARTSRSTFRSVQNQFSLLDRSPENDGTLDACRDLGIGFLPYYPLANGWLTGKFDPDAPLAEGTRLANMAESRQALWWSDELKDKVRRLRAIALDANIPLLSLAFSWLASHSAVSSVIAGASNPEQVRANAVAVQTIPDDVLAACDEATR